jgi:hypothetical protein
MQFGDKAEGNKRKRLISWNTKVEVCVCVCVCVWKDLQSVSLQVETLQTQCGPIRRVDNTPHIYTLLAPRA